MTNASGTSSLFSFLPAAASNPALAEAQAKAKAAAEEAEALANASLTETHALFWVTIAVAAGSSFDQQLTVINGYTIGNVQNAEGSIIIKAGNQSIEVEASSRIGQNARLNFGPEQLRVLKQAMAKADPGDGSGYARCVPFMCEREATVSRGYAALAGGTEVGHLTLKVVDMNVDKMFVPSQTVNDLDEALALLEAGAANSAAVRTQSLAGLASLRAEQNAARMAAARGETTTMAPAVSAALDSAIDASGDMED